MFYFSFISHVGTALEAKMVKTNERRDGRTDGVDRIMRSLMAECVTTIARGEI